ncbi:MAG: GGDEF domain-containing protein [Bilophila sp.]
MARFRPVFRIVQGLLFCVSLLLAVPAFAAHNATFTLSAAEKDYVTQAAPVRVAVVPNMQPFMYCDKKGTAQGVVFDVLTKTAAETGLRFDFVLVQTLAEAAHEVNAGHLDVLGLMVLNAPSKTNLIPTMPYISAPNLLITGKDVNTTDPTLLTAAALDGSPLLQAEKSRAILSFLTLEDSLEAIRNGRADYTRINIYTAHMLLSQLGPSGFVIRSLPTDEISFGFGVSPFVNQNLVSLLNKSLLNISETAYRDMIDWHTQKPSGAKVSWLNFIYLHTLELLCAVLPLMLAIMIGSFTFVRIRTRNNQKISGYEESYRLLANTLGEVGIEYDYLEDKVTFLGRSKDMLALDTHIESFREKLKAKELPLSLTLDEFNQVLQNGVAGKSSVAEFQCLLREKGWAWFQLVCTVVCTEESHRRPVRLIGCLVNVDAERRETELLRDLSQIDPLTGLLNRATANKCIREHLPLCTAERPGTLLLLDIDNFKHFNDSCGHLAGDAVLKAVALAMKEAFRAHDVLARWGGDEFIVFLKDMGDKETILSRTEQLRAKLKDYRDSASIPCPVTISIGGASAVCNGNLDEVFQQADDALYEVKRRGRDGFLMYTAAMKTTNLPLCES